MHKNLLPFSLSRRVHLRRRFASARVPVFAALALLHASAMAFDPEPFRLGFLKVVPDLNTKVTDLGSMKLANGEEESAELLLIKPRISAFASDGHNKYSTMLEIHNGNYSAAGATGFLDWKVEGTAQFAVPGKNPLKLRAEFFNTHEGLDKGFTRGNEGPDKLSISTINADYQFGSDKDLGRVVLDANSYTKHYLNNEKANANRDHSDFDWGTTYTLNVLPGTNVVMQYRHKDVDFNHTPDRFDRISNILDKEETYSYVGATWEGSADTLGKLKIAYGLKRFDNPGQRFSNIISWETKLRWEPISDSVVSFDAGRVMRTQSGSFKSHDTQSYNYLWEHRWSQQLKSSVAGNFSGNVNHTSSTMEKGRGLKVRMDYTLSNWLEMFVSVGRDERENLVNRFGWSQNTFRFGIAARLERLLMD